MYIVALSIYSPHSDINYISLNERMHIFSACLNETHSLQLLLT